MTIDFFFQVHTENFENHIKNTLQRTTSQPLLASGSTAQVTPSEYIHLLNRAIVTLRTNYLQPQKIARMEMEKRCVEIVNEFNIAWSKSHVMFSFTIYIIRISWLI